MSFLLPFGRLVDGALRRKSLTSKMTPLRPINIGGRAQKMSFLLPFGRLVDGEPPKKISNEQNLQNGN